jgi:hypothetical protein
MQLAAPPIVKKKPAAATPIATPTFALMFHRADERDNLTCSADGSPGNVLSNSCCSTAPSARPLL